MGERMRMSLRTMTLAAGAVCSNIARLTNE
jgi:hypothetical protein